MSTNLLQKDVEQSVPVVLARVGYEKRRLEDETAGWSSLEFSSQLLTNALPDENGANDMLQVLQDGIASTRRGVCCRPVHSQ